MGDIKKVAILGAGMMGSDIALSCALAGYDVLLKEVSLDLAAAGVERIRGSLAKWSEKGRLAVDAEQQKSAVARITPVDNFSGFGDVDLVIEAIFEDLDVKSQNFRQLEEVCKPSCIIASNTSSLPITKLGACFSSAERKSRFVGMHFFSPAAIMKLVEVVNGEDTSAETVETACAFCTSIGKEPIKVNDCAGFVVNRILGAINDEAIRLLEENVASAADIDKACQLGLGHPVGPFALMDQISNELNLKIARIFHGIYGDRFLPRPALVRKVDAGHFGRKTGKGWFDYSKK
ncbi:3-hydroxyacyl-CoA dehydrogenase [Geobacter metallireducens GS-15]|uniref:3-hydroxyacyl-CoA dehydrogenase n=1 Tax=Geobacter metallireducens (strain ATCC 53774 / DSM 7210 / GS-15) TaxID=269799 RepID=Q39TJ4_GEOMG|nr:3-hydroxyacyl-CoA dehydrogenase family protein [Geobacter metallireducens]ABB32430.1 3-hydroxyacyl-CoA dehydrogenase [Geobacter metallireducens GS-15]